jgi:hypothetical protein
MKYLILLFISVNAFAGAWFVGDKIDLTIGGKIPALQVNSCKNIADDLTIKTTNAKSLLLGSNDQTRLFILSDGRMGFGTTPSTGNSFEFASTNNGSANASSIFSTQIVTGAGATQQQGIYAGVHSTHDAGTVALMRNYFTAEHSGDGTVTETFGARALTRLFDNNAPGDVSSGIITTANGLEAYANNTSTGGGIIRNAYGVRISHSKATGTDAGQAHKAVGLLIEDDVVASGGDTNTSWAIESLSTAKSMLSADLEIHNNKPLTLTDGTAKTYSINSPAALAANRSLTLPALTGSNGDCIKTDGSGVLSFGACGGGGGGALSDLTDVSISSPTNNQVLTYVTLSGKWENKTSTGVAFGGNANSADSTIGLTDAYKLSLKTSDVARLNISATGAVTVGGNPGDFSTQPSTFGVYKFQTSDDSVPYTVYDSYFSKFGNSSSNKIGALYNLSLNNGDSAPLQNYLYSGEYTGFRSNVNVGASTYATVLGARAVANSTYASSIINNATGLLGEATATGIIRTASGLKVGTVSATGSDTSNHVAIGLDIAPATESYALTASGSSITNTAIGLRIGNTITGDAGLTYAIKSDSTARSTFTGGVQLTTGSKPTCDSTTRGTFWHTAGGAGVKDSVEVCAKDAGDAYAWRTIY